MSSNLSKITNLSRTAALAAALSLALSACAAIGGNAQDVSTTSTQGQSGQSVGGEVVGTESPNELPRYCDRPAKWNEIECDPQ